MGLNGIAVRVRKLEEFTSKEEVGRASGRLVPTGDFTPPSSLRLARYVAHSWNGLNPGDLRAEYVQVARVCQP